MLTRPYWITNTSVGGIIPFNATQDYTFEFGVIGGDQIVKNQIQIYNNTTNELVFDSTVSSFTLTHLIPANTLTNGATYKITVRTYNVSDTCSDWSDYLIFKCLSNATITFSNIVNGKINNQTELFQAVYSQAENSELESYKYFLYNSNSQVLDNSDELFDGLLQYEFGGFENETSYYIQIKGTSVDGLEFD